MAQCVKCGMRIATGKLCGACRAYIRRGGAWHKPSPYGTVTYDDAGRPICHICGMAFDKLIEHTKRKHGLDSAAYRQAFGLMLTARLTGPMYHQKMKNYVETTQTYVKNFESTHSGERRYCGGRKPGWSAQEVGARHEAQVQNGKQSKKRLSPERLAELGKVWAANLPKRNK